MGASLGAGQRTFVCISELPSFGEAFAILRQSAVNNVIFQTIAGGVTDNLFFSASPWDGLWHMVTAVLRRNPETGEDEKTIYFDGVSVATSNPGASPDFSQMTNFDVGHFNGADLLNSSQLMDDIQVLPWAAPSGQVSGWFGLGRGVAGSPRSFLDGDIIPEDRIVVDGRMTRARFVDAQLEGDFRNARRLQLELREV